MLLFYTYILVAYYSGNSFIDCRYYIEKEEKTIGKIVYYHWCNLYRNLYIILFVAIYIKCVGNGACSKLINKFRST